MSRLATDVTLLNSHSVAVVTYCYPLVFRRREEEQLSRPQLGGSRASSTTSSVSSYHLHPEPTQCCSARHPCCALPLAIRYPKQHALCPGAPRRSQPFFYLQAPSSAPGLCFQTPVLYLDSDVYLVTVTL